MAEGVRDVARRELGYLREDTASFLVSVRGLGALATPARRANFALIVAAVAVVYGLAQWWVAAAWVFAGLASLGYALFLVDLDPDPSARAKRRRTAVKRKGSA